MNNVWISADTFLTGVLAQVPAEQQSSGITSEPVTEEGEAMAVVRDPNAPSARAPAQRPSGMSSLVLIGLMFVVMYFLLFRGPRKKQQRHKQMVQSLQRNDKVHTIGGIIGTVVDIKGDEITLKVDEANNTKIKIAASAIGKNLSKE